MKLINGVDIVDIRRIEKILEKGDSFLKRYFTNREVDYILSKGGRPETVAGIFAAKEALSKALGLGIGSIKWKDIEINHEAGGRPYIKLSPSLGYYGIGDISLSISHERHYAIAFVVGFLD